MIASGLKLSNRETNSPCDSGIAKQRASPNFWIALSKPARRTRHFTECPAVSSLGTNPEPMKPVAPVRIILAIRIHIGLEKKLQNSCRALTSQDSRFSNQSQKNSKEFPNHPQGNTLMIHYSTSKNHLPAKGIHEQFLWEGTLHRTHFRRVLRWQSCQRWDSACAGRGTHRALFPAYRRPVFHGDEEASESAFLAAHFYGISNSRIRECPYESLLFEKALHEKSLQRRLDHL